MIIRTLFALLFAAIAFGTGQAALAEDAFTPRPAKLFFDKPQLDDYADYNDFLVDIMEYRRQREAFGAPLDGPSDKPTTRPARPETLQEALQKAGRDDSSPPGIALERYGRTTPDSMPLPELTGTGLAEQGIAGVLQDMNTVDPQTYTDDTAREHAEERLADYPTSDKARDKKARSGTQEIDQVSYDPNSRLLTDSYGNTQQQPVYVPNEVGSTVIRNFNIDVGIINK